MFVTIFIWKSCACERLHLKTEPPLIPVNNTNVIVEQKYTSNHQFGSGMVYLVIWSGQTNEKISQQKTKGILEIFERRKKRVQHFAEICLFKPNDKFTIIIYMVLTCYYWTIIILTT